MTYTTTTKIYQTTSLTNSDVGPTTLDMYISDAMKEINREINAEVIREPILHIDPVRDNIKNGTNKTFYTRNFWGRYFGDRSGDGTITVADIIVYNVDSEDVETKLTVSSIDYDDMSFVLETAPESTDDLFITYSYSYFDVVLPDRLIEMATRYLATSYAYTKVEYNLGNSVKVGNLSITGIDKNSGSSNYAMRYKEVMHKIKTFGNSKNLPVRHNITRTPQTLYSDGPYVPGYIQTRRYSGYGTYGGLAW